MIPPSLPRSTQLVTTWLLNPKMAPPKATSLDWQAAPQPRLEIHRSIRYSQTIWCMCRTWRQSSTIQRKRECSKKRKTSTYNRPGRKPCSESWTKNQSRTAHKFQKLIPPKTSSSIWDNYRTPTSKNISKITHTKLMMRIPLFKRTTVKV